MSSATAAGSGWRHWKVDPSTMSLVLVGEGLPPYSISLRGITSSACMLDAIFALREQDWVTEAVLADLILAFQDLFDPRMTLCGGGKDRHLDAEKHLGEWIQ